MLFWLVTLQEHAKSQPSCIAGAQLQYRGTAIAFLRVAEVRYAGPQSSQNENVNHLQSSALQNSVALYHILLRICLSLGILKKRKVPRDVACQLTLDFGTFAILSAVHKANSIRDTNSKHCNTLACTLLRRWWFF